MEQETSIRVTIRNWKHGYRALLHMRWAAAFGFHLSVVGLVGVVGIVLAVIRDDKLREKRKKHFEKIHLVPGLQNLGNNCFLNVILQALASCSYFQPFLQKILEECDSTLVEGQCESLPLIITLSDLLEELGMAGERRVALSPHKVMLALALYIQNFDLTSHQDAAEAILHLLSSLREEFPMSSSQSTLADFCFSKFANLFNAILDGWMSLEDCLWQFVLAEKLENYYCSHCWHSAAIKYLSCGANEILCLHLQRASMNEFGELIKLQGHISFPLILDLSSFMTTKVEITNWEGFRKGQLKLQSQKPRPHLDLINVQYETIFNHIRKPMGEKVSSETLENQWKSKLYPTDCSSKASNTLEQHYDKVSLAGKLPPSETKLYRLVSVVEHFGRSGGGHYTVYRNTQVRGVSEKDVLAAEASLFSTRGS
ncbi:Cationic amino acid transporter 8 [Hibiscus syriacus]|uniref:Ubiquitin carboxyl-terminal hydrolase n=1 Tax=Hibiscus syriacus TaxID=106335 RepID=A0A6A2YE94_HIBSY|nr:Cationic amino acid transporter 8 [Hibiscus syriacus]